MKLDQGEAERIAARVVELLRHEPPPRFVDAAALARILGVERDWVYSHAAELGAVRLGGPRGRLRFDRRAACERFGAEARRGLSGGRKPDTPRTRAEPGRGRRRHREHETMPTRQSDHIAGAD
jgi:hypothetical protein